MNRQRILSDALIIAAMPLLGYLLLKAYYNGAESNLSLPQNIGTIDIHRSVDLGFSIFLVLAIIYCASEIISRSIPPKNDWLVRFRRIVQVSLFIGFSVTLAALQRSTGISSFWDALVAILIICAVVSIPFIIRDVLLPLVIHRQTKEPIDRLNKLRTNEIFLSAEKYYRSFLSATNIGFLLVTLLIMYVITYNVGAETTDTTKGREYLVIESNPKRIVLINYGNRWITAKYDDSYPDKPAYRKEYSIIDSNDMAKEKFSVKYIPQLYIYN